MKSEILLVFLSVPLVFSSLQIHHKNYTNLAGCVEIIIEKVILKEIWTMSVVPAVDSYESRDFRQTFMKNFMRDPRVRIRIEMSRFLEKLPSGSSRRSSVIDFRNYREFLIFRLRLSSVNFKFNGYFIFVLTNGKILEIGKIFRDLWQLHIYNVILIYEDSAGFVPIVTFFPFRSRNDCTNTSPVIVNEYFQGAFLRENSDIFIRKMEDLKQCEIRISTADDAQPYIYENILPNGTKVFEGRDYELLRALSKALNFRINFTYIGDFGTSYKNGTMTGAFKVLQDRESDMGLADYWLKPYRLLYFDASTSYSSERIGFVFPVSEKLSSIDRLLYPLERWTWIFFVLYLIIGNIAIFVVTRSSKVIQNFVFGKKIKNPYLNLWIVVFGTTQHRLPGRNFSRFLLMNFLIFTLILRTAYQGKLYHFLQANIRYPEPQNIDSLIDLGYNFMFSEGHLDLVDDVSKFPKRTLFPAGIAGLKTWYGNVFSKTTLFCDHSSYLNALKANESLRSKIQFGKENFLVLSTVVFTTKNFFLLDAINDCINELISGGLIKFWHENVLQQWKENKVEDKDPHVMTLDHLFGLFELWAGGCMFSIIVMIFEVLWIKFDKWRSIT